ncbi:MAG: bifunctional diguanylate cyclase/phosphodiesterase [bacterium]
MFNKALLKKIGSTTLLVDIFNELEVTQVEEDFYNMLNISEDDFKMMFNNKFLNIIDVNARKEFLQILLSNKDTNTKDTNTIDKLANQINVIDLDTYSPITGKISLSIVAEPLTLTSKKSNKKNRETCSDDLNAQDTQVNIKDINTNIYKLTIFNKNIDYEKFEEMKIENSLYNKFFELRNVCTYVVEKNTYELLYFNDLLKTLMPNLKVGSICYTAKGFDKPCKNCHLKSSHSYSSEFLFSGDKDWVVTTSELTWKDSKEAYVIYGKNVVYNLEEFNTRDFLTGAPTLISFKTKFNNLIFNKDYALVSLDIEKFKYINNIWGNMVGDNILKKIASTIDSFLKPDETFCRISDDKFILLLHYKPDQNDEHLINKLNNLKFIFDKMKEEYFKYMSVSIAYGVCKIEDKFNFDTLLDMSNIAKLSVKGHLNVPFRIYDKALQDNFVKQSMIHERLESAIKNQEFVPFLQPKFNLITNKICGAEALVRWKSFDGMIYPDEFIPIFEKNGFITTLDFIIYEQVFRFMRDCLDDKIKLIPISLNASREHVLDKDVDFIDNLFKLINRYKIPLNLIEIEITENAFMGDKNLLKEFVDNLRNTGIKVSVDDFGSAYSSLNSLKDIDVDIIKLDKAFLSTLDSIKITNLPSKDKIIVANMVKLTKDLKLNIICEGIETEEQLEFLKDIGCECGQGYLFSRPLPIEEFKELFL